MPLKIRSVLHNIRNGFVFRRISIMLCSLPFVSIWRNVNLATTFDKYTPRRKFSDTAFKHIFKGLNFKISKNQNYVIQDKYIEALLTPKWWICVLMYWYGIRLSEHGVWKKLHVLEMLNFGLFSISGHGFDQQPIKHR